MNIIEQFTTAIYKFKNYGSLLKVSALSTAVYYVSLSVICTLITVLGFVFSNVVSGKLSSSLEEIIPNFELTSDTLSCDKIDYADVESRMRIYIDTKGELSSFSKYEMTNEILADSKEVYFANGTMPQTFKMSDVFKLMQALGVTTKTDSKNNVYIDKSNLIEYINSSAFLTLFGIPCVILLFFGQLIQLALDILVAALVMNLIKSMVEKSEFNFSQITKLSIYMITFPELFFCIFYRVPGIRLIYYAIIIAYAVIVMKNIERVGEKDGISGSVQKTQA